VGETVAGVNPLEIDASLNLRLIGLTISHVKHSCMAHKHYQFPSLNGLAAFEAAGRHMSLTRAAQEMNVTPGAVSKHIKALEAEVGAKLFVRLHRSLELTSEGVALLDALKQSFVQIAATLDGLRKGGPKRAVTIGTTNAFAQFWLMPRLGQFWKQHQDIVVDHVISDRMFESGVSPVDLRVRYGSGTFQDEMATKLFDDVILPVASPAFLKGRAVKTLQDVAQLPLLSVEGVDSSWTNWPDYLKAAGVPAKRLNIRRFNSYVIAVQASLDGQGVALGWRSLVTSSIAAGRLKPACAHQMTAPQSFYLTWSLRRPLSAEATTLKDWLLTHVT
jgi:LysR family transcriptional regulator, glycine cleavage system transcriptional activator